MCNDVGECSRGCAFYSVIGMLFTLYVFVLISTQPFYIAGLEDPDEAKASAFGAMIMFAGTLALSVIGIFYDNSRSKESGSTGNGEETMMTITTPEGYVLNTGDAPGYGSQY